MNDPRVREATLLDIGELARLVTQLGYPSSPSDMQGRLEAISRDSDYHTLVADTGACLVGVVGIRLGRYYERNGMFAQIAALVVDEAERGSGIGGLLLEAAERWAASRGASDVWITSHQQRQAAHRFYEAHGYQNTGFRFRKVLEPGRMTPT